MNDILRVEFGALQHASNEIDTALRALQQQLEQIERDAAPLVSTWEGEARQAYHQRQTRWREAASDLSLMLRDIKRALDESAADYVRTESSNTTLFGSR
jgi:early secretory antigenic target protein ESAT-6